MIIFEKIRWKNLLSTGNHFTEVELNRDSTTLIIGSNGSGKSTILDALTFVLYGKSFRRINKSQLINTTNENNCLVEIEFLVNSTGWKVIRGIKPNIFQIYKDGKLLDQSSSVIDQQKWLEQNVLKMNYKSFTQIIILGSSNFVPFMQLPISSRREVVEDLLDIKIFSSMNNIIKEKIRSCRDEIRSLEYRKQSFIDKIDMQRKFINEIENQSNSNIQFNKEKIDKLMVEMNYYIDMNDSLDDEVSDKQTLIENYTDVSTTLRKLGNIKGKLTQKISFIQNEVKFFEESAVCPTCTQSIEEPFRLNRIGESQNKEKELQRGFKELEDTIRKEEQRENLFKSLSGEISKLLNGITSNNTQISGCQKQIRQLESEIQIVTEQLENRNIEHEKLSSLDSNLQETYKNLANKKENISYYDFTYSLLKDGGVKSKIIKKYLPLINQQVNRYLQMMDFYINFKLDEEFNETIESPIHEDFSYSSFSEGEKMRIDLAILFTWREVARFKNSVNTNLLIMDEVFDSSLDGFGTEEFIKIIRFVIKDANIFVISHKEGMSDKFKNCIKFDKKKGFSSMMVES